MIISVKYSSTNSKSYGRSETMDKHEVRTVKQIRSEANEIIRQIIKCGRCDGSVDELGTCKNIDCLLAR